MQPLLWELSGGLFSKASFSKEECSQSGGGQMPGPGHSGSHEGDCGPGTLESRSSLHPSPLLSDLHLAEPLALPGVPSPGAYLARFLQGVNVQFLTKR